MMASSREFLLEYSRFHSIARDHLAVDPAELLPQHAETEVVALLHTTDCFSLDLDLLRKFSIGSYEEKLSVSKACAVFLTSVVESSAPDYMRCAPKWDGLTLNRHRIANIKQEYPLLRTDPEYDMQLFQSSLSETRLDMDLPPEKLYNERDEGLSFPNYIHDLPVHIQEQIAKEKLDCTREVLVFLQELVNASAAPPVCPDGKRSPNYSRVSL